MNLKPENLDQLSGLAIEAAKRAGAFIQSKVGSEYKKESKGEHLTLASQVVTEIDIQAQEIILKALQGSIVAYDLGLLTEESTDDSSRLEKDYFWSIDPMDGTLAFTEGRSGYAVSISLIRKSGDPIIGVVYIPDLDDCYSAIAREGVKLNGKPFRSPLGDGKVLDLFMDRSFPFEPYYQELIDQVEKLASDQLGAQLNLHLGFGAVRNALAVLGSPQACYFKFPKPKDGGGSIWDFAATHLFFGEMNLAVSAFDGQVLSLNDPETTFMNRVGVLYASSQPLADSIRQIGAKIQR